MKQNLNEILENKKVLVLLGPGGVGKTSCSIGLAVYAASKGKKVGLLSIDPARRLASALGIKSDGSPTQIKFEKQLTGSVEASMLDQKTMFDRMVHRYAPNRTIAEKIIQHPLYQAASSHLAGSIEYMALARLKEMVDNKSFDLVVLDTPPDSHALDFLARPDVLSRFHEHKVMNWLIKPFLLATKFGLGRLMNMSEKLMGGVAQVTGFKALHSFAEFLVLIQQVIDGFHSASQGILKILHEPTSSFFLVTAPTSSGFRTALALGSELKKISYKLDALILNRVLPEALSKEITAPDKTSSHDDLSAEAFLSKLWERKMEEENIIKELSEKLSKIHAKEIFLLRIEEKDYEIHNTASILPFAQSFENF